MADRSIQLVRLFGIPIKIDFTWFIIFALISWTLSGAYFPMVVRGLDGTTYWIMGISAALLLFISVLIHELGHSYAATKLNIPVKGITLFLFGGVSETTEEPPNARAELIMTASGWLISFILSIMFFAIAHLLRGVSDIRIAAYTVIRYMGWINLFLFIFNGLPGLPLDGGRLLRAVIWYFTGNLRKATYIASSTGSFFGILVIVLGIMSVFVGNLIGGMWLVLIGFFLRNGARASYDQLVMRNALEGVKVKEIMSTNIVSIPAEISIEAAVNSYFMKYHFHSFPVLDNSTFVGIVSLHDVRNIERDAWGATAVREIVNPDVVEFSLHEEDDAMNAVDRMTHHGIGRLPVIDDGHIVGIVSRRDVMHLLNVKQEIGS